jgi:Fungal protein kinase
LNSGKEHPPAHDYLDDLESFFYVFCWICFGYEAPGRKITPQPAFLSNWEDLSCSRAAAAKVAFLFSKKCFPTAPPYFGPVFQNLLEKLQSFFFTRFLEDQLESSKTTERKTLEELIPQAKLDYAEILEYIDKAVEEFKVDPTSSPEALFKGQSSDPELSMVQ